MKDHLCLDSLFCMWVSSCSALFSKKTVLAPLNCLCSLVEDQWTVFCVGILLGPLFCSMSNLSPVPHSHDYFSIIVKSWSQVMSFLWLYSSLSALFSLFWIFCFSIYILELVWHYAQNVLLEFRLGFHWIYISSCEEME